ASCRLVGRRPAAYTRASAVRGAVVVARRAPAAAENGRLEIRGADHARHAKPIAQLTDAEQTQREQPDQPGNDSAGIEAMNAAEAEEAKQPKQVSDPGRFHGGVP